MKKVKVGFSFVLLLVVASILGDFYFLFNYLLALTLHELAHLFVATSKGYKLKQFKLDIFGVSMDLDEQVVDKDQFLISVSGPLCNLLLCLICVACYYLFPSSYVVLSTFCTANLILAVFNLLPVYPLDGGKIFYGIIKNKKVYKVLDAVLRYTFAFIFLSLFIVNLDYGYNLFYLIMVVFFVFAKRKNEATFSLFKPAKERHIEKVDLIKVDETCTLFELVKLIKKSHYTIFYCPTLSKKYFDEQDLVELSLKHSLTHKLADAFCE